LPGVRIWQWAQKQRVYDAEDGCSRANAKRKRCYYCDCKDWATSKPAPRIANVLQYGLQQPSGPPLIALFARAFDASEGYPRLPTCFFWGHSRCDIRLSGLFEVKLQFVVKIARSLARHEEAQASQDFS
jgi:hypothetical protein